VVHAGKNIPKSSKIQYIPLLFIIMHHSLNKIGKGHGHYFGQNFSINMKPFYFHFRLYKTDKAKRGEWREAEDKIDVERKNIPFDFI
jgi:hypothetical protein